MCSCRQCRRKQNTRMPPAAEQRVAVPAFGDGQCKQCAREAEAGREGRHASASTPPSAVLRRAGTAANHSGASAAVSLSKADFCQALRTRAWMPAAAPAMRCGVDGAGWQGDATAHAEPTGDPGAMDNALAEGTLAYDAVPTPKHFDGQGSGEDSPPFLFRPTDLCSDAALPLVSRTGRQMGSLCGSFGPLCKFELVCVWTSGCESRDLPALSGPRRTPTGSLYALVGASVSTH